MDILSTIKPDIPKKPEVKIEYNDRSYQSYIEAGFHDDVPDQPNIIPRSITGPRDRMKKFLSLVDLRKGPIERSVRSIVRVKAPDWTSKKNERREFVYYEEYWDAKDWLGVPITKWRPDGHIEGRFTECVTRPKLDDRTGEHVGFVFAGIRESYFIPFSKKNVDEIIANSAHTDKDGIRYVVKFGMEDSPDAFQMSSRNQFNYDKFVNWSWEKLREFQYWPVDDLFNRPKDIKSANKLEFKPS